MGPKTALIAVIHSASLEVLADNFALVSLKTLLFLMAPFGWRNFGFSAPLFSCYGEHWSNITQCATTIRSSLVCIDLVSRLDVDISAHMAKLLFYTILTIGEEYLL